MLGTELVLIDRQCTAQSGFGLFELTLLRQDISQSVERTRRTRVSRAQCALLAIQRLLVELARLLQSSFDMEQSCHPPESNQSVSAVRAEPLLANCQGSFDEWTSIVMTPLAEENIGQIEEQEAVIR